MEDLRLLLIGRLKAKGMVPLLIPVFLKTLLNIIGSKPGIEQPEINQKLHSLGWDEVVIDYHSLQIALACLEAESQ